MTSVIEDLACHHGMACSEYTERLNLLKKQQVQLAS